MTSRPAFFPILNGVGVDDTHVFEFTWHPGFAFSQKQRNVTALHDSIRVLNPKSRPLEVSSKSFDEVGVRLSAFNLSILYKGVRCTVESIFQASKVFEKSGPFPELYSHDSREVRAFVRENMKGNLIAFEANGIRWSLNPTRSFYDWVYLKALEQNPDLAEAVMQYDCFTDIEFNPKKSLNCQAYAVALYLSLHNAGVLEEALSSKESFVRFHPADVVKVGVGENVKQTVLQQATFEF